MTAPAFNTTQTRTPKNRSAALRTMQRAALGVAIVASSLLATSADARPATAASDDDLKHLRVAEANEDVMSLDIAITTLAPKADEEGNRAEGPLIRLVGVAHIADGAYYRKLEEILAKHDIVLYESVMPPGAAGASGADAEERIAGTRAAMAFVASAMKTAESALGRPVRTLDEARNAAAAQDPRFATWFDRAKIDAWGRPLELVAVEGTDLMRLRSLGSDGQPGGVGEDADLVTPGDHEIDSMIMSMDGEDDGLQKQLAEAVGLDFQLESIDYDQPNFICSDMTMDQLNRAFNDAGVDFEVLGGTLAGTSLPARVIKVVLGLIRAADQFMDGAVADMFKVMLIEMLGDEAAMEMGMQQMGAAFGDVIVGERNQVVMDDLQVILNNPEKSYETIAVFYGAAHNADFVERMDEQLGYEVIEQEWLPAITVDLEKSAVDRRQLAMIRMSVRRAMRQLR